VQVHMQRMDPPEIREILDKGAEKLDLEIDKQATAYIIDLSQGLLHYAHLVGLHAVRAALGRRSVVTQQQDVKRGVQAAVENAQQSRKNLYHQAATSSHRAAIFRQVLLACALA
jgi:DNA helicase TIP49 (TBP-interacting protein)